MTRYVVSGTVSPDCTTPDTGEPAGTYNGQNYWTWTNDAGTWYLWWFTSPRGNAWTITAELGSAPDGLLWYQWTTEQIIPVSGEYPTNGDNSTGTATVATRQARRFHFVCDGFVF